MTDTPDHACRYIRDIERLILKVDILTTTMEQRLEKGEHRFKDIDDQLEEILAMVQAHKAFEQRVVGGYKVFLGLLTFLGTVGTIVATLFSSGWAR